MSTLAATARANVESNARVVHELGDAISRIKRSGDATKKVRDISNRMNELNSLAQSVAAGAEEGASGAEEMRSQAAKLGEAAEGFKTRDWDERPQDPTGPRRHAATSDFTSVR